MNNNIIIRNGSYYYYRRVPAHVQPFDNRTHIKISLKTKDEATARKNAQLYNDQIEEFWRSLIDTNAPFEEQEYRRAVATARLHGFTYKSLSDVAKSPLKDVVARINAAHDLPAVKAKAILGAFDVPPVRLSACLDKYWPLCVDLVAGKSDHQVRKWKNPRKLAFENFMAVVGDKAFTDIDRQDEIKFREWLAGKIRDGGLVADTANKMMTRTRDVLLAVGNSLEAGDRFDEMFRKMRFSGKYTPRPPFEAAYVQDVLLRSLDKLNDDAKYLVFAVADTGARESDLIALDAKRGDIVLDAEIPHIWIRPRDGSGLKTATSERKIPLVGAALEAFKRKPDGFTRYEYADSVSNLINNYLKDNDLRPTPKHSLYSLRHTMKDRLRDAGAPEEVIDEIMGHEGHRPKYGRGQMLKTKQEWLAKIAFKV